MARTHQKAKHRFAKLTTILSLFRISDLGFMNADDETAGHTKCNGRSSYAKYCTYGGGLWENGFRTYFA